MGKLYNIFFVFFEKIGPLSGDQKMGWKSIPGAWIGVPLPQGLVNFAVGLYRVRHVRDLREDRRGEVPPDHFECKDDCGGKIFALDFRPLVILTGW